MNVFGRTIDDFINKRFDLFFCTNSIVHFYLKQDSFYN